MALTSLGCSKNLVDSERMLGLLVREGFTIAREANRADVVIVNTCGFIESAKEESVRAILDLTALKRAGRVRKVIVSGCLAERYADDLRRDIPDADGFLGVGERDRIVDLVRDVNRGVEEAPIRRAPSPDDHDDDTGRFRLTPRHYAYLKISEGCNRRCTFCIIPRIRGDMRSKPIDVIEAEARELAASGALEINLVSQDTTDYGFDISRRRDLPALLRRLDAVEGVKWFRMLYCHPQTFTDEIADVLAGAKRIAPYVDIPFQHASDRVLSRMKRGTTRADLSRIVRLLRNRVPGVTIRSTFLVGFPGETDADFHELLNFLDEHRLDRVGCFTYSREENTPAFDYQSQVPADLMRERLHELMSLQREIAFELAEARVGTRAEAIVQGASTRVPGFLEARGAAEAPDVDPVILLPADCGARAGDMVRARFERRLEYDLVGRVEGVDDARCMLNSARRTDTRSVLAPATLKSHLG
ncbi:MAG: 30S ribosomal protein S12 methylthiotransferase RimO [Planctomycetes bacterium]|nr:30S ribosomal protein S12 methylthiotransferase RimO [Planctomycetota bacterium]